MSNPIDENDIPVASNVYSDWTRKVVENFIETEKKLIELASQQNALTLKAIREGVEFYRSAPTPALADWARQGVEGFVEAQRRWTESATQQRARFFQYETETPSEDESSAERKTMTDYAQQQVEALVEARRRWLDFAARQNAQFLESVKSSLGIKENSPTNSLTDWAQQAVENYVEVQKRWLDFSTQFPFQRPYGKK